MVQKVHNCYRFDFSFLKTISKNYKSVTTPLFSTAVPLNAVGGACALTSRVVPPRPFTSASLVWLVGNGSNIRRNEGSSSQEKMLS